MPRRIAITIALVLLSCALSGCHAGARPLSAADIQAHRDMSQEFLDRVHAGDWDGLSEMYTEDAVVMQPNQPAIVGREAIRAFWAAMPPIRELRFIDDAIVGEGDLVYVYGRYWLTFDLPGEPGDEGKYLDVRARQPDGGWKYVAEMANSSLPQGRELPDPEGAP